MTPEDLVAIREIEQLKYRYIRALDTKDWDAFSACLVPEATGDYGGLVFEDRESLVKYMRENMMPGLVSLHQVHHPEIEVSGNTATGTWYLQDKVMVPEFKFLLEGAAFYSDRYLRTKDGWRIVHTGYQRTYEATSSTDDQPSLVIKEHPTM